MIREFKSNRLVEKNDKDEIVKIAAVWKYFIDDREVPEAEYRLEYEKELGTAPL